MNHVCYILITDTRHCTEHRATVSAAAAKSVLEMELCYRRRENGALFHAALRDDGNAGCDSRLVKSRSAQLSQSIDVVIVIVFNRSLQTAARRRI